MTCEQDLSLNTLWSILLWSLNSDAEAKTVFCFKVNVNRQLLSSVGYLSCLFRIAVKCFGLLPELVTQHKEVFCAPAW